MRSYRRTFRIVETETGTTFAVLSNEKVGLSMTRFLTEFIGSSVRTVLFFDNTGFRPTEPFFLEIEKEALDRTSGRTFFRFVLGSVDSLKYSVVFQFIILFN